MYLKKQKQVLAIAMMLMVTVGGTKTISAAESDYLKESDGWFEVTTDNLSSLNLGDYYFAFYDLHDVMLGLGGAKLQGSGNQTVWFQRPANPIDDHSKLWCIETMTNVSGHESQYTLRNYLTKDFVMETDGGTRYIVSTNRTPNANSGVMFTKNEKTTGYWTLRNGLSTSNYLGPWDGGNFNAPQECAFNKSNADNYKRPTQVKIYAILRTTVEEASRPPLTPAWILGHIIWEDEQNTQSAIEGLVDNYRNRDIPVHATIIDSPWATDYNTFEWDTNRYPNHDAMIDGFMSKDVKVILWLTGCVNTSSSNYNTAKNYGVNDNATSSWWKGTGVHIDFTNPEATAWWYTQLDKAYRSGIYGWKVDQGEVYFGDAVKTSIGTLTNEQFRPYYYNAMEDYIKSKNPSAGANIGRPYSHQKGFHSDPRKMSMGWCGDFAGDWSGLKLQIDNIYRSTQAGYAAVGTEIAGFMGAKANKTQFTRYAQFGAMTACMINGGENGAFSNHLPWWHGSDTEAIYRDVVKLHTSLIPYMFSTIADAHLHGGTLMQNVNLTDESHQLGSSLFTKAITSDAEYVSVFLPAGAEWIDWSSTGTVFEGGKTYVLQYPLDRFPLFIRRGDIIPMDTEAGKTTLRFYPLASAVSQATFHLPQGEGIEYDDCAVTFDPVQGTLSISDAYSRSYVIEMKGVKAIGNVSGADSYSLDAATGVLRIDMSATTSANLTLTGLELAELETGSDIWGEATVQNPLTCSDLIPDYPCMVNHAWTGSGRILQSGQHWSGDASREYYACNYIYGERYVDVVLPHAGLYRLSASVRAPENTNVGTFEFGDVSVTFPGRGYEGGTIATDGTEWESIAAGTAAGKTFANGGLGYGWYYGHIVLRTDADNKTVRLRQVLTSDSKSNCGGIILEYMGNASDAGTIVTSNGRTTFTGAFANNELNLTVADGVTLVDLTDAIITDCRQFDVTASPNALFLSKGEQLADAQENVVISQHVRKLHLTDGYDIQIPDGLTANVDQVMLTRTLTPNIWNTLCLPFTLTATHLTGSTLDGATIYGFESSTPTSIHFSTESQMEAGCPYLLKFSGDDPVEQSTFSNVVLTSTAGVTKGDAGNVQLVGKISTAELADKSEVCYLSTSGVVKKLSSSGSILGLRSYFLVPGGDASLVKLHFGDDADGIDLLKSDPNIGEAPVYDLTGRRIVTKHLTPGFYIINGKIMYIKS